MSRRRSARLRSQDDDKTNDKSESRSASPPEVDSDNEDFSDKEDEDLSSLTHAEALEHIRENYTNPNSRICYQSISGLKEIFPSLTRDEIQKALSKFESWSLMKSTRRPKKYNPFLSQHIRDCWQIDTVHLQEFKKQNAGISYLLCAVDVFSKHLWVRPLHNCKAQDAKEGLEGILQTVEIFPESIVCDRGPEFRNKIFEDFCNKMKIKLIFTKSSFKASVIERTQLTLERLIFSHITARESLEYVNFLQQLVHRYNVTRHSFTKYTPQQVEENLEVQDEVLLKFGRKYQKIKKQKPKFKIGDTVRIQLFKGPFFRGYNLQFSYERYQISKIIEHKLPMYILEDEKGREILGLFNEFELVPVELDRYRVNVLDRKRVRNRNYVKLKYKGYPEEFTEWVEESKADLIDAAQ